MILFSRNLKEKNLDCQVQVQQAGMTGVIFPKENYFLRGITLKFILPQLIISNSFLSKKAL